MSEPACEWVLCEDEAEPGALYCKPHARQARQEGTPWRRPGVPIPPRAKPVDPSGAPLPPTDPVTGNETTFTAPPPAAPPARPLSPDSPTCRFCDEPPLERTLTSRSNRWRNLCERHYAEARRNALGPRRRAQLLEVLGPPAPSSGNGTAEPVEVVAIPDSYADRAWELVDLGAEVDAARTALADALERWRRAVDVIA